MIQSTAPEQVLALVQGVQQAIGRRDIAAIARVSRFPILVLDGEHEQRVRNARDLARRFDEVFDPVVLRRIADGRPCSLQAVADEGLYYAETLTFTERVVGRLRLEQVWKQGAR